MIVLEMIVVRSERIGEISPGHLEYREKQRELLSPYRKRHRPKIVSKMRFLRVARITGETFANLGEGIRFLGAAKIFAFRAS